MARAREIWEGWAAKVGTPHGDTAWAYLTRAQIADLATQAPGADRLGGVWEALLYVEKAIVHDRVDAQRWGYASQYLRYVHLDELAFEAADRGYSLGAGDRQVLVERLAQLESRGRLKEAERVADELVTMFGNDPWVSAARAWIAIHSDRETRFVDGLGLLELPLAEGNDPSWYYEMRALCHAGLHELDAAREDCAHLLEHAPAVDGTTKCRLAVAAVAVDDAELAAHWSAEASKDPTARAITCLSADAFAALSRNDLTTAEELLARATEHATSVVELRDIVDMMRLRLPLLSEDGAVSGERQAVLDAIAEGPARQREEELTRHPRSSAQELAEALAEYSNESTPHLILTTLRAVQARRHAHAGSLEDAATCYQRLLGSSLDPEASVGLAHALRGLAVKQAAVGEVEQVRQLMDRMTALGDTGPVEAATAVALALERSQRPAEAREQLEAAIEMLSDDRERAKLHQRAGGLALVEGELERASAHFAAALETALKHGAHGRCGQVRIRMALIAILRNDMTAAGEHLWAAVRAWKEGGALDPTAALTGELRGLQRLRAGSWEDATREALRIVEKAVAPEELDEDLEPAVTPLRNELRRCEPRRR